VAVIFPKRKHKSKKKYEAAYSAHAAEILEIFGGEEVK
jgi:hypothetical protein